FLLQVAIKAMSIKAVAEWIQLPGEQQLIPIEIALMKMVCKAPVSPGIIQLIDWSVSHSEVVLILEHPEPCLNLLDFLSKRKKFLGERLARRIFLQVVEALQHCQARGVFHRDVKVDNVLIQSFTHQIKLIDFGCGALLQEDEYTSYRGTRKYAPPEWFTKRRYLAEPATVWSLGILLYMLLYGSIPFEKKEETIKGKVKFHRKVSRECWNLIRRCLSLHPADRPSLTDILGHSCEIVACDLSVHFLQKIDCKCPNHSTSKKTRCPSGIDNVCQ
uniref:non-specific serine/threonine protein kinase n=1 Tax=Erpetoichthys calabaricus TaxID=27687 RepID=A0A8C4T8D4_ERPCA